MMPVRTDRLLFGIRARSADRIVPELQHLAVGDRVRDSEEGEVSFFTVAAIEANRALVLHFHTTVAGAARPPADRPRFGIGDVIQAGNGPLNARANP